MCTECSPRCHMRSWNALYAEPGLGDYRPEAVVAEIAGGAKRSGALLQPGRAAVRRGSTIRNTPSGYARLRNALAFRRTTWHRSDDRGGT